MVVILSVNDIILNMINLLQLSQPLLDTKPGSVARDLVIDAPSSQIALLYDQLSKASSQQSLRLVVGSDLDKLAKNFGLTRNQAIASNGIALLTFANLQGTININPGSIVTASNGFSFSILNGLSITSGQANFYKSIATTYANDLQFLGITDQYAVQATVQATTAGSGGNIPQFGLISTTIPGVTNVTNTSAFTGGSDIEDDATFRNRILSIFSGSSVGTALGYKNTALSVSGVQDAYIIGPGDPLMTRDGTVTMTNAQGVITIVSEGTGGKVNIAVLGNNLTQYTDSYIYQDKSNNNDPTSSANNFVLGQLPLNTNLTFNQKRLTDLAAGTLPAQPVNLILQVTGSTSGPNFIAKSTDSNGVVSGNYELIKDTSVYAGSPWGFDTFHWTSNQISNFPEDDVKGQFNGQDNTTYSGIIQIPNVQQNISITNENSIILSSNNSLIQLLHTPATNVTRVFNVNTGEQYTVINQNPNGTGLSNTSGIIQISGNTLPTPSNVLQVDYSWIVSYDQFTDYDGKLNTNNLRESNNSIDWGYSNLVKSELVNFSINTSGTFFTGSTVLPISSVISAGIFAQAYGTVTQVTSGTFAGRLSVIISNLPISPTSIDHVYFQHTFTELYNTAQNNGSYSISFVVVGINLEYVATIILPSDTTAVIGSAVTIIMDTTDTFNIVESTGSINQNQITIPAANITPILTKITNNTNISLFLNVIYIANIQNFLSTGISSLPISRVGNGYLLGSNNGFNNINLANISRREFQSVQLNLSSKYYVELNLSSLISSLTISNIISVIRLSDGLELWNADNLGSILINQVTNNYQLIFNGFNSPVAGNSVLIIYYANDISQFQPFSFSNSIIERDFSFLQYNPVSNQYNVPIHNFIAISSNIHFQILEPDTNIVLADGYDGYLTPNSPSSSALFGSPSILFNKLVFASGQPIDILYTKIKIINSIYPNDNNIYDITSYNSINNELTIENNMSELGIRQVSIIRLIDGQELWSDNGIINTINNQLIFPYTTNASPLDKVLVLFYKFDNLKQAATRIAMNISDQVVNTGTMTFSGTTIIKSESILFTATNTGLNQNIISAYRNAVGLPSNAQLPTNVRIAKIAELQKVNSTSPGGGEVLNVIATYDLTGMIIQDNTFYIDEFFSNLSLGNFDFILPNTSNNIHNAPKIGDTLKITFYYSTTNDTESISFTRNGTLYTNKTFAIINNIYVSSGFNTSQSATITLTNFNQPITGSRYTSYYNYLAPQPNERIVINYNYNQLISSVTSAIENSRPINADVLVQAAGEVLVDITMDIVVAQNSINTASLIIQNVQNALVSSINATSLGTTLDSSSLINAAFAVNGVAAARIITFNIAGNTGQVLTIVAQNNQYLVANNITITQVAN